MVEVSLGRLPDQRSYTLRVRPSEVDLDAIARLDDLVQDVLDGRLDAGRRARASSTASGRRRSSGRGRCCSRAYAIAGAALTPVLGGGWREAAAGGLVGLVVGGIAVPDPADRARGADGGSGRRGRGELLALARSPGSASRRRPSVVTLAALVTFLPGMRLTIGMRELATEHLQSGVANTASALVQLLGLVLRSRHRPLDRRELVRADASRSPRMPPSPASTSLAAVAAGLAFTLMLRARYRDAFVMCAATVLALGARELGAVVFGDQAAVFVAALAVGIAGGLAGRCSAARPSSSSSRAS